MFRRDKQSESGANRLKIEATPNTVSWAPADADEDETEFEPARNSSRTRTRSKKRPTRTTIRRRLPVARPSFRPSSSGRQRNSG